MQVIHGTRPMPARRWSLALVLACAAVGDAVAMAPPQGGGPLRGPAVVATGGTIDVHVGTNDSEVEVSAGGPGAPTAWPVGPGRDAHIPVPNVPAGTVLAVAVGKGLRRRVLLIEVVDP